MRNIRMVCCDLDGTLLKSDRSISEENIRWISKLRGERNIPFAFITGRPNISVRNCFSSLGFTCCSSCLNGCMLYSSAFGHLTCHTLPPEVLSSIVRVQRITGVDMLMLSADVWFTEHHRGYLYENKLPIYRRKSIISPFEEVSDANKVIFMHPEHGEIEKLYDVLIRELDECPPVTFYPGRDFLEIMPGGINKGTGLEELSFYCKTDLESIMVIGDDVNDIPAFEKAGFAVAMGNASDEVKSFADHVTADNDHDGVARAIEHVFFGGSV
ncbi:MAG: Cof-type HAD-IIB family hydrolase [Bullifex sp.]